MEKDEIGKEIKLFLEFVCHQIDNGTCTEEQLKSWHKMLADNIKVDATISDFAEFYGQSENNVRNVISRRMADKPKRRVFYDWFKFEKIIPKNWIK